MPSYSESANKFAVPDDKEYRRFIIPKSFGEAQVKVIADDVIVRPQEDMVIKRYGI